MMNRRTATRRNLATAVISVLGLLGMGLQTVQGQNGGGGPFKFYFQTAYWSGDYDITQDGFEPEDATIIIYSSHLFRFQEEFRKGPDVFDHDEYMRAFVDAVNRDVPEGYTGLVLIDYEAFPITLYDPHRRAFIDPRVDAILEDPQYNRDGQMTWEEARDIAQEHYGEYARPFFSNTLTKLREMRPDAKVGYYSMVSMDGIKGVEPRDIKANDAAQWLYDQADILAPYAYLWGPPHDQTLPSDYSERGVLADWGEEWVRLRDNVERNTGKRPLLLPYIAISYGGHCDENRIMPTQQLARYYKIVRDAGADGAIQWLSVRDDEPEYISEPEYIDFIRGPMQEALEGWDDGGNGNDDGGDDEDNDLDLNDDTSDDDQGIGDDDDSGDPNMDTGSGTLVSRVLRMNGSNQRVKKSGSSGKDRKKNRKNSSKRQKKKGSGGKRIKTKDQSKDQPRRSPRDIISGGG